MNNWKIEIVKGAIEHQSDLTNLKQKNFCYKQTVYLMSSPRKLILMLDNIKDDNIKPQILISRILDIMMKNRHPYMFVNTCGYLLTSPQPDNMQFLWPRKSSEAFGTQAGPKIKFFLFFKSCIS